MDMSDTPGKITGYRFGRIEIDGRRYSNDVIVHRAVLIENWRRKRGHELDVEDLAAVPLERVSHLIVGTGYFGVMSVNRTVIDFCRERGIDLEILRTPKAVERFNECLNEENLVGAFHLTC